MEKIYQSDLVQGVRTHDCISFDWMDTLVMRRVPYASDVFSMVEQRISPQISFPFCEYRIRAEKNLIAGGFLPSAENIYAALSQLVRLNEQELQMLWYPWHSDVLEA